jgi:L-serine dehydratase
MSPSLQSIFEVYACGAGPSSSHSIGPQRAARLFVESLSAPPARIRVTLFGSLAATGRGHWTDRTLVRTLDPIHAEVVFDRAATDLPHPNTLRFEAFDAEGRSLRDWTVCSIGGGSLREADGRAIPSTPHPVEYPVGNIDEAMDYCRAHDLSFWQLVEQTEVDLWPRIEAIWNAMRDTVKRGLESKQIILPGTLELARRAGTTWHRAQGHKGTLRDLGLVASFALAVAEENAAGMQVVTAPSCGASGVLPAVLYFYKTVRRVPTRQILEALAVAGLFGASIRANATVSGAEAGCQAEIGSACSMAAAAAAHLHNASLAQIEYAAEMAMEHNLGLTCDPIEGYVQIPCIERNMNAALRAIECAAFTLLTDGRHLVSFDDVVEVMDRTGRDLQAAYRETSTGGLAQLWRRDIESRLRKKAMP